MLNLTNVSKTYPKSSAKAVDSLNLDVKDGEIFGFLGPNGAGKSTTIKLITGILNPDEGAISVDGMNIADNRVAAKKSIGYVSDNHAVYEKLTGREYLDFMGTMFEVPLELRRERAEKLLEEFGLTKAANDQIGTYSHGMKQKINNGRLVAVDTLDSIKSSPDISLEKVFLDITNFGGELNP